MKASALWLAAGYPLAWAASPMEWLVDEAIRRAEAVAIP